MCVRVYVAIFSNTSRDVAYNDNNIIDRSIIMLITKTISEEFVIEIVAGTDFCPNVLEDLGNISQNKDTLALVIAVSVNSRILSALRWVRSLFWFMQFFLNQIYD